MSYKKYTHEFKRDMLAMVAEGKRSIAQLGPDPNITLDTSPAALFLLRHVAGGIRMDGVQMRFDGAPDRQLTASENMTDFTMNYQEKCP